jgi:hypothetical protein
MRLVLYCVCLAQSESEVFDRANDDVRVNEG